MLNEDVLNIEIRKFLKKVGITCQREIEKDQILAATVVLEIPTVKLKYTVDGQIKLE